MNIENDKLPLDRFFQTQDLSSFTRHLLSMENRFRFCHMFGDFAYSGMSTGKGFTGYNVTKNHIYIIADGMVHIHHEMAHMVEMNNMARILLPDWGMRLDLKGCKPSEMIAATAREIRVRAIQEVLNDKPPFASGAAKTVAVAASRSTIVDHPSWGPSVKKVLPFGRFKNYEDFTIWAHDLHERTRKAWNKDRIEDAWKLRLNHIQNYMETVPERMAA